MGRLLKGLKKMARYEITKQEQAVCSYTLKHPITYTSEITVLHFRPMKAKDYVAVDGLGDNGVNLRLLSRLTGYPDEALGELWPEDYRGAVAVITEAFFRDGPETEPVVET